METIARRPGLVRIVLTGSESTGKSTLAAEIARHYDAELVPEFVRAFAEAKGAAIDFGDHGAIARGQMALEDAHLTRAARVLVQDTDLLSTVVYCRHYFGQCPPWIEETAAERRPDVYLLCGMDVPWVADGVRDRGHLRDEMQALFESAVRASGTPVVEIHGNQQERLSRAIDAIDHLLSRADGMHSPAAPASPVHPRGKALLDAPLLNKGTAFTDEERTAFGLHGLLPPQVETLDQQVARAYHAYLRKDDDLERHIYLRALQDTNEVLFYRLLQDHMEEMTPIVYTPVVALACEHFHHIYRRPRGLFVPYPLRNDIPALLANRPNHDVDVIVVTDGERILGIGDQGAGGLGIPIGKLALYTLIGGIDPARTLPIVLDVGTNNHERLDDPEYLGWRHERISGEAYYSFIEQFVDAVKHALPHACLQWEDLAGTHARPILERYRGELLTFNDDIQGTAAAALGALLGAVRVTGRPLIDQHIVMFGAGAAAIGVADYIRESMVRDGLSEHDARRRFWIVNRGGLLHTGRADLNADQHIYAQAAERVADWPRRIDGGIPLDDVVRQVGATVLIGLSTVGGAFREDIIREMARKVERPIIFPLSNPTAKSEATAEDVIRWTDGRALVATGSPFAPVVYGGRSIRVAQCNNVYIFPALGLGLVASRARRVTDGMILAAAGVLGAHSPALKDPAAPLLPALTDLRTVVAEMAFAVGAEAQRAGVAPITTEAELRHQVAVRQWRPAY